MHIFYKLFFLNNKLIIITVFKEHVHISISLQSLIVLPTEKWIIYIHNKHLPLVSWLSTNKRIIIITLIWFTHNQLFHVNTESITEENLINHTISISQNWWKEVSRQSRHFCSNFFQNKRRNSLWGVKYYHIVFCAAALQKLIGSTADLRMFHKMDMYWGTANTHIET